MRSFKKYQIEHMVLTENKTQKVYKKKDVALKEDNSNELFL